MSKQPVIPWTIPGAHALLHKLSVARLGGKELSQRRPSLVFRLPADAEFVIAIQPRLVSSPTGWRLIERLPIRLESDRGGVAGDLPPDDTIKLRRWWKDPDRTAHEIEVLRQALLGFVVNPLGAVRLGLNKCAVCGRPLRDPESVSRGIGPECWGPVAAAWLAHGGEMEVQP